MQESKTNLLCINLSVSKFPFEIYTALLKAFSQRIYLLKCLRLNHNTALFLFQQNSTFDL